MRLFYVLHVGNSPIFFKHQKGGDLCDQCESGESQRRVVTDPGGATSQGKQIYSQPLGNGNIARKYRNQAETMRVV